MSEEPQRLMANRIVARTPCVQCRRIVEVTQAAAERMNECNRLLRKQGEAPVRLEEMRCERCWREERDRFDQQRRDEAERERAAALEAKLVRQAATTQPMAKRPKEGL